MANWCNNEVEFSGNEKQRKKVLQMFSAMARKGKKTMTGQVPAFASKEQPHFFDISVQGGKVYFDTKWKPNNDLLREIADHFKLDFVNKCSEYQNGLYAECKYTGGTLHSLALTPADFASFSYSKEQEAFIYNDKAFEYEDDVYDAILGEKKARVEEAIGPFVDNTNLYEGRSNITAEELHALYDDLGDGDLLLKFAEHGNFDGARGVFNNFDEASIVELGNFLVTVFQHLDKIELNRDKYIAFRFLDLLITEWDANRQERDRIKLEELKTGPHGELLSRRLAGELPRIDIAGTDFTIDWRMQELRETGKSWNRLGLGNMERGGAEGGYAGFYHTANHTAYIPDERLTSLPKDVVFILLPNEMQLDPVAIAREMGLVPTAFIADHPIQPDLKAIVKPLSESYLPDLIQNNIDNRDNYPGIDFGDESTPGPKIGR